MGLGEAVGIRWGVAVSTGVADGEAVGTGWGVAVCAGVAAGEAGRAVGPGLEAGGSEGGIVGAWCAEQLPSTKQMNTSVSKGYECTVFRPTVTSKYTACRRVEFTLLLDLSLQMRYNYGKV